MGGWREVTTQLGIGIKPTIGFPSSVYQEGWDV